MARWLRKMDKVIRARYDEVIDIYGWLGDFTVRLDPDHDEDLQGGLLYVDSMVAGWISEGQFENPRVAELVLDSIAAAEANRASHPTPPADELWRRMQRLRELASS